MANTPNDKPALINTLDDLWVAIKAVEAADEAGDLRGPFVKSMLVFKATLYGERTRVRKITTVKKV